LTLRSKTDSDLAHVEIGRLLDREGHGPGNGTRRQSGHIDPENPESSSVDVPVQIASIHTITRHALLAVTLYAIALAGVGLAVAGLLGSGLAAGPSFWICLPRR